MAHSSSPSRANYCVLSGPAFFIICAVVALLISAFVRVPLPTGLLAFQVIAMVLGLFIFGPTFFVAVIAQTRLLDNVVVDFKPVDWFKAMAPVTHKLTLLMAVIITHEILL